MSIITLISATLTYNCTAKYSLDTIFNALYYSNISRQLMNGSLNGSYVASYEPNPYLYDANIGNVLVEIPELICDVEPVYDWIIPIASDKLLCGMNDEYVMFKPDKIDFIRNPSNLSKYSLTYWRKYENMMNGSIDYTLGRILWHPTNETPSYSELANKLKYYSTIDLSLKYLLSLNQSLPEYFNVHVNNGVVSFEYDNSAPYRNWFATYFEWFVYGSVAFVVIIALSLVVCYVCKHRRETEDEVWI